MEGVAEEEDERGLIAKMPLKTRIKSANWAMSWQFHVNFTNMSFIPCSGINFLALYYSVHIHLHHCSLLDNIRRGNKLAAS